MGAGAIGSHLAGRLSSEGQDVVVIESDETRAGELQQTLDALVITGNGASQDTLREARAGETGLLIAVSNSDGANVLACHNAHELGVDRTIARVEDPSLRTGLRELGVDVVIDPEASAAKELLRLARRGGVSEMDEFADGRLVLVGGTVEPGALLDGSRLSEDHGNIRGADWAVVAVERAGEMRVLRRDTAVEAGDRVFVMTTAEGLDRSMRLIGLRERRLERAFVVGSTRLAELAVEQLVDGGYEVVVVDHEAARARRMAQRHQQALVLRGDPTDPMVLSEQHIGATDALFALTGWDEVNVMSCLVGRALGVGLTAAHFHRLDHLELLDGVGIDATVSGRLAAANEILGYVRGEHVHVVASIKHAEAEALEVEVATDAKAVGSALHELDLPEGSVIGGIVRAGEASVPERGTVIEAGDHLVVFCVPAAISKVERLLVG